MKLSPFLWGALFVIGALVLYGHWRDTQQADAVKAWERERDSLNLAIGISDAESVQLAADAGRWERIVDSLVRASPALPPEPQPIPPATVPTGTASDSVTYWHARADTLEGVTHRLMHDNHALRESVANRDAQLQALGHLLSLSQSSDSLHTAQRDTAVAIANRAPVGHKRGLSLLGVRLCPSIGVGYGATLQGGVVRAGPTLAVVQPLSCGA